MGLNFLMLEKNNLTNRIALTPVASIIVRLNVWFIFPVPPRHHALVDKRSAAPVSGSYDGPKKKIVLLVGRCLLPDHFTTRIS